MSSSFLTQVAMAILSAGILYLYVYPTFVNIGVLQDSITVYQKEREKVIVVNEKLADLTRKVDSITPANQAALLTYLPNVFDDVAVTRDILNIALTAEVFLRTIKYNKTVSSGGVNKTDTPEPVSHSFTLSISGGYEDIKLFLSLLEQNNYPLEVRSMQLNGSEGGIMDSSMTIYTYSQQQTI